MAGMIRALFGGRSRPPDPDPLPGQGGYRLPTGRTGEGGYSGSTGVRRTFKGTNPRSAKVRADTNTGWDSGHGDNSEVRQAAYRGELPGAAVRGPRATRSVVTRQGRLRQRLQSDPREFYGGIPDKVRPGADTVGGNPLSGSYHSVRATETPAVQRQPVIGTGVPGSANVRNSYAQRYLNPPGQMHTYLSSPRGDLGPTLERGQAADGNVHPERAAGPVTVPNRFVFRGGGNETWYVERQMPYTGRGDGARGADLNGTRYYATFGDGQFLNAGQGNYGIHRERGGKRPVSFTEPAPWTANFYDTTEDIGTNDSPTPPRQARNQVYISPTTGRASNRTGRT